MLIFIGSPFYNTLSNSIIIGEDIKSFSMDEISPSSGGGFALENLVDPKNLYEDERLHLIYFFIVGVEPFEG